MSTEVSARDRLLHAASELFYEHGVHTVGIDTVIERAGVAKATLYSTFGSKEALVRAYLEARHASRRAAVLAEMEMYDDPKGKLLAVFDVLDHYGEAIGVPRLCAFAERLRRVRTWTVRPLKSRARSANGCSE